MGSSRADPEEKGMNCAFGCSYTARFPPQALQMTFPNQTLTLQQTIIREHLLPLIIKAFINPLAPLQATGVSRINSVVI